MVNMIKESMYWMLIAEYISSLTDQSRRLLFIEDNQ